MANKTVGSKATLKNHLGLDRDQMNQLGEQLNFLLSDYQLFYQNVRGFHWNVKGSDFFDLHIRFEALYELLSLNIDALAERIVSMGFTPLHSFSDYLVNTGHKEITNVSEGKACVTHVINGLGALAHVHHEIVKAADDANDIATADLLTKFTGELEKQLWMFTKFNA